jgi:hypothetical protein
MFYEIGQVQFRQEQIESKKDIGIDMKLKEAREA